MLIMSQSRGVIIFTEKTQGLLVDDGETGKRIYAMTEMFDEVILGEYKTKERTYQVFYDIMIAYSENANTFIMPME